MEEHEHQWAPMRNGEFCAGCGAWTAGGTGTEGRPITEAGRRWLAEAERRDRSLDQLWDHFLDVAQYRRKDEQAIREARAAIEAEAALLARRAPGDREPSLDIAQITRDMASTMPWYDEVNPDYAEAEDVLRRALAADSRTEQPRHLEDVAEAAAAYWLYRTDGDKGDPDPFPDLEAALDRAGLLLVRPEEPPRQEPQIDVERLNAAIRRVWQEGHDDLRSGMTTDPEDATLATAITKVYPDV